MISLEDSITLYPDQVWLELPSSDQETAWQQVQSQAYSHAAARDRAFYNTLCLNCLIPWFTEEFDLPESPTPWQPWDELPTVWEFLNGSILEFPHFRIGIIPTDAYPFEQLCIEREWIDIPGWTAHYYLAVQVNVEAGWLRILGYATHRQLKWDNNYDALDQTYSANRLMQNLQAVPLSQAIFPQWQPFAEMPWQSSSDLDQWIERLSKPLYSPRLDLPFSQWSSLIANSETRRSLYQRRTSHLPQTRTKVQLSQWSKYVFETGWQAVTEILNTPLYAIARGTTQRAKLFTLENHAIALIVSREAIAFSTTPESEVGILLEARAIDNQATLPQDLILSVSFQDQINQGDSLEQSISARTTDVAIQLPRLLGTPGEEFSVTLSLGTSSVTEEFVI